MFGLVYLGSAITLGAWFLIDVLRVYRHRGGTQAEWSAPAWKLYKFSLLYLALLFAAMAVDRHI
jgi:protoheme IX farnesyltransferase